MDEEVRRLERVVARLGNKYGALLCPGGLTQVSPPGITPEDHWEQVTLVGLSGHPGCLVNQSRRHFWLVQVHTIEALAALPNVTIILDLRSREQVRPYGFWASYMHDLEVGWTELTDKENPEQGESHSSPYRKIGRLWNRPDGWRGPMHDEIDRCEAKFIEARARIAADEAARYGRATQGS